MYLDSRIQMSQPDLNENVGNYFQFADFQYLQGKFYLKNSNKITVSNIKKSKIFSTEFTLNKKIWD